jgi:hypothetical protein
MLPRFYSGSIILKLYVMRRYLFGLGNTNYIVEPRIRDYYAADIGSVMGSANGFE